MNYKERIERLKEKGIFSQEQARRLEASFGGEGISAPEQEGRGVLEFVGLLLVAAVLVGLGYWAVAAMRGGETPQEVVATLNSAYESGIGASSAFWVLLGMVAVGLYLLFYGIVRNRYGRLWSLWLDRRRTLADRRALLTMESALTERLERMRQKPSEGMESRSDLHLHIEEGDEARRFAMQTIKELAQEAQELQERSEALKMRYQRLKKSLPGALAALAGKLPDEEER